MRAVEVTYGTETFYLSDTDGNGWHKVVVEGGGPHWGHKSVTCAEVIKERGPEDLDVNDCYHDKLLPLKSLDKQREERGNSKR
jgi:hypothetical protein